MPCRHGNPIPARCELCRRELAQHVSPPQGVRTGGAPVGRQPPPLPPRRPGPVGQGGSTPDTGSPTGSPVGGRFPPPRPGGPPQSVLQGQRGGAPVHVGSSGVRPPPPPPPPRVAQQVPSWKGRADFDAFLLDVGNRTGTFTRRRSSLAKLLDHLEHDIGNPTPFSGATLEAKYRDAVGKCGNPNDSRLLKYKPAIESLVNAWGTTRTYVPGAPGPASSSSGGWTKKSVKAWIDAVKSQLDAFKTMAVLDAQAYSGDINPPRKNEVLARAKKFDAGGAVGSTMGDAFLLASADRSWNADSLASVHKTVTAHGRGVCTSFARAAAHVLTDGRARGPRVELVSYQNPTRSHVAHVFVIVGRQGGAAQVSQTGTWGNAAWIVDAWIGAMGYDVVYDVATFPKPGYLQNLTVLMERPAS
jgi:hypothetical protein